MVSIHGVFLEHLGAPAVFYPQHEEPRALELVQRIFRRCGARAAGRRVLRRPLLGLRGAVGGLTLLAGRPLLLRAGRSLLLNIGHREDH